MAHRQEKKCHSEKVGDRRAKGEQSANRWDRRGSNLRCSMFNANVTVHYFGTILGFDAHLVLLHALWGAGFGRHHAFFKFFEKN